MEAFALALWVLLGGGFLGVALFMLLLTALSKRMVGDNEAAFAGSLLSVLLFAGASICLYLALRLYLNLF